MAFGFYDEQEPSVLPHPEICLPVLLVVENAPCAALHLIRTHPREGFNLLTAAADSITLELYEVLFDRVFKNGASGDTSKPASRGHFKTGQLSASRTAIVLPYR